MRSTDHEVSRYVVFSTTVLHHPFYAQIISSAPYSHPQPTFLPKVIDQVSHPYKTTGKIRVTRL